MGPAPAGGASGYAALSRPRASPLPGRRCTCPARGRFPAASCHSLKYLDRPLMVRVNAKIRRDGKRLLDDLARSQRSVLQQRQRGALGKRPARADGDDAMLRLKHVARAGDDQRMLLVRHGQHRFEPPQDAVGAPILGELDCRAHEITLMLVELALEALEEREGVGGAAGETGQDAIVMQAPHFLGAALHHHVAERDLPVAAQRYGRAAAHRQDRRAMEVFHRDWTPYVVDGARDFKRKIASPRAVIVQTMSGPGGRSDTSERASPAA